MAKKDLLGEIDLLGELEPEVKERVKPRGKYHKATDEAAADALEGYPMRWFQVVFSVERKTVSKAVEGLRPVKITQNNIKYYHVKDVAARLVTPKMSREEYFEDLTPDELPEHLRETYWNVQAKSQRVREAAGELWRTTDVIEVLGETFKHIKNTIMLWCDTIEEQVGITDEQREIIIRLGDDLQNEIHKAVIERANISRTRSQLRELDRDVDI